MAGINTTPEEFINVIVALILDSIKDETTLSFHPEWRDLIEKMDLKGISPYVTMYYLNMDARSRVLYKSIKEVFHEKDISSATQINIRAKKDKKSQKDMDKEQDTLLKKAVKRTIQLLKAERERSGYPINEAKMDKIIEYVIENHMEEK